MSTAHVIRLRTIDQRVHISIRSRNNSLACFGGLILSSSLILRAQYSGIVQQTHLIWYTFSYPTYPKFQVSTTTCSTSLLNLPTNRQPVTCYSFKLSNAAHEKFKLVWPLQKCHIDTTRFPLRAFMPLSRLHLILQRLSVKVSPSRFATCKLIVCSEASLTDACPAYPIFT